MAKTNRPPAFMALTYSPVTRLYRSGAGRGSNHARLRSASELDRIHAALLVGHEQHAAVVLVDIVGQRRLHAVARLRDEIAALLRGRHRDALAADRKRHLEEGVRRLRERRVVFVA